MGSISRFSDYVKGSHPLVARDQQREEIYSEDSLRVFHVNMPAGYKSGRLRHSHQNKRLVVTEGSMVVHLDKGVHRIKKDEQILIMKNRAHCIENFGDSTLKLIDIRTGSRFRDDKLLSV